MKTIAAWTPKALPHLDGKHFVITGANSGIGLEAAKILASKGGKVSLLCRDVRKAQAAMEEIEHVTPGAELGFVELDLMSFDSIRAAADVLNKCISPIDCFINNAGIMAVPFAKTKDGYESQFGTNHLGHFLLNGLLFNRFKRDNTRVVSVSSIVHHYGRMNFSNLNGEQSYQKWIAYGQAKLANLHYILELQRRLDSANIEIKAVACHPGYSSTNLQHYGAQIKGKRGKSLMMSIFNGVFAQSSEQGSWPTVFAAAAEEAEAGGYYGPKTVFESRGKVTNARVANHARNKEHGKRLWNVSEEMVGHKWGI